jgi:hypothetical protein
MRQLETMNDEDRYDRGEAGQGDRRTYAGPS